MGLLQYLAAIGPLLGPTGTPIADLPARVTGKRVGLYFSAGWCPMCTRFEPHLLQFRKECAEQGTPIELIYVPSDRSEAAALGRANELQFAMVAFDHADALKKKWKVWAGSEVSTLGSDRRSGVPAIVVVSPDDKELAFVDAERSGADSLKKWNVGIGMF